MKKKVLSIAMGLFVGMTSALSVEASSIIAEKDGMLIIEGESMSLKGKWSVAEDTIAAAGKYIHFTGANYYGGVNDTHTSEVKFKINSPGSYLVKWLMRQPDEVEGDKSNDAWINFPDGIQKGNGEVLTGFHKFVGRSKGEFGWNGTVMYHTDKIDDNGDVVLDDDGNPKQVEKSAWMKVEFPEAGIYTLELSGRSELFQLDRFVIFKGISNDDAQIVAATKSEFRETIAPVGETVAFKAASNGKYLCSDKILDSVDWRLVANRATAGAWETFTVLDAGDGMIALKAVGNGKFVSASSILDPVTFPLAANKLASDVGQISNAEKFSWIINTDGTVSLKAESNGMYVSADKYLDAINTPVIANRTAISGWEKFTVEIK